MYENTTVTNVNKYQAGQAAWKVLFVGTVSCVDKEEDTRAKTIPLQSVLLYIDGNEVQNRIREP